MKFAYSDPPYLGQGKKLYGEAGVEMRHRIGLDNIMFESDYPHSDSNWPTSRKKLEVVLAEVPDDEARQIAELNARRVFNFPRTG